MDANKPVFFEATLNATQQTSWEALQDTAETKDEEEDLSFDAQSFILLMAQAVQVAQVVQALQGQSSIPDEQGEAELKQVELNSSEVAPNLLDVSEATSQLDNAIALDTNVAMAWIDSVHYQPALSSEQREEKASEVLTREEGQVDAEVMGDTFTKANKQVYPIETNQVFQQRTSQDSPSLLQEEKALFKNEEPLLDEIQQDIKALLPSMLTAMGLESTELPEVKERQGVDNILPTNLLTGMAVNMQPVLQGNEPKTLTIPAELNSPQWANQFSEHIVWLGQQGIKSAFIKIHPESLGPLEITINVVKEAASVSIASHSSYVCHVVDKAIPMLREMMSSQGMQLADVQVGTETSGQQFASQGQVFEVEESSKGEESVQVTPLLKKPPKGLVDYFA